MPIITPKSAAAVTTHEAFAIGGDNTIANNDAESMPWGVRASGDVLLDLTVPTAPTIITAGVYACTVRVIGYGLTAGGYFVPGLNFDYSGDDQYTFTDCHATVVDDSPSVSLSLTYYCPAGAELVVRVTNVDGVSSRLFVMTAAYLQRLA